jgi:ubiquinone/menaquinone biosynthesis C-methylase UbiE
LQIGINGAKLIDVNQPLPAGDYVLGTDDEELKRLGVQHLIWRPRVMDAWRRAGFNAGQHILDVGCGPGYATLDLASIVERAGRVTAVDRSPRFLTHATRAAQAAGLDNVDFAERDLDASLLPAVNADGAWCRWVFAFLSKPRELIRSISASVKPGGKLVIYEYFDYATWKLVPRSGAFEKFVEAVMKSWRHTGGEPDIAIDLISWLPEEGFEIVELRPFVDVVSPVDAIWQWPSSFVEVGLTRLVELGHLDAKEANAARRAFADAESNPDSRLITPAVLEIIARRV